jgi:ring-1,2-phenylacetyl-CoA epoxidase subunit PaaA
MFQFCMDRGAGHQLEDSLESSYRPWARVMEGIFREEMFHIAHGDSWVKRLAQDPKTHDEVQAALNKWYPRTMNIFGRPNSPRNKIYRRLGLKKRDNHEVRLAFANEVRQRCQEFGLDVPPWTPDWGKLPEEAAVVG